MNAWWEQAMPLFCTVLISYMTGWPMFAVADTETGEILGFGVGVQH